MTNSSNDGDAGLARLDLSGKLHIKVNLGNDYRRKTIHNEEITYDELILMMQRIFAGKLDGNDEVTLKYKDEDGDLVLIEDDSDLAEAIRCSRILKLTISINKESEPRQPESLETINQNIQQLVEEVNKLADKTNKIMVSLLEIGQKDNKEQPQGVNESTQTVKRQVGDQIDEQPATIQPSVQHMATGYSKKPANMPSYEPGSFQICPPMPQGPTQPAQPSQPTNSFAPQPRFGSGPVFNPIQPLSQGQDSQQSQFSQQQQQQQQQQPPPLQGPPLLPQPQHQQPQHQQPQLQQPQLQQPQHQQPQHQHQHQQPQLQQPPHQQPQHQQPQHQQPQLQQPQHQQLQHQQPPHQQQSLQGPPQVQPQGPPRFGPPSAGPVYNQQLSLSSFPQPQGPPPVQPQGPPQTQPQGPPAGPPGPPQGPLPWQRGPRPTFNSFPQPSPNRPWM